MRIALLVGACPRRCGEGPLVRLIQGEWRFEAEGLIDSIIHLRLRPSHNLVPTAGSLKLTAPVTVQPVFIHVGNENFVTLRAVRQ